MLKEVDLFCPPMVRWLLPLLVLFVGPWAAVPPSRFRAVVSDVDGTLLPFATHGRVSRRNRRALQEAAARGSRVLVATGRIPGPWYEKLCRQLGDILGPGVFCNGALVLDGKQVLHGSVLTAESVARVVDCLADGRVLQQRIGALAVVATDKGFAYSELAPDGPSWVTQLIQRAGEPVVPIETWNPWLKERAVHKFVMFTDPQDDRWVVMEKVVQVLRQKLGPDATVLDCGQKQCEILPAGENKGRWLSFSSLG